MSKAQVARRFATEFRTHGEAPFAVLCDLIGYRCFFSLDYSVAVGERWRMPDEAALVPAGKDLTLCTGLVLGGRRLEINHHRRPLEEVDSDANG